VYWVVDTDANGDPISLTMNELRAFESGAPISIAVTQVKANVLKLDSDGAWKLVGDATEFATRCDASCADIFLDMGEGSALHALVYCGCRPSEPIVTLGDALAWCANGFEDKDGLWITYTDKEGIPQTINLENWRFVFDRETMILNGIDPDDMANTMPADFRLSQMLLHPDARIFAKAPRDPQLPKPTIHYAYLDYDRRRASVCATDYQGIVEVLVSLTVDPGDGTTPVQFDWPMDEYTSESNIYSREFTDSEWSVLEEALERQMDPSSGGKDVIKAVARAMNGEASEMLFGLVPPNPQAVAPIIDFVQLDVTDGTIYARVLPDTNYPDTWHQTYPVQWVKAFHPAFLGTTPGVIDLGAPVNSYEDYYGWIGKIPAPWHSQTPIKVVAYVSPGVYTEHWVTPSDTSSAFSMGSAQFYLQHFWFWGVDPDGWKWQWIDVDYKRAVPGGTGKINGCSGQWWSPSDGHGFNHNWQESWTPSSWADVWARWDDVAGQRDWKLYFNVPWAKVTPPSGKFDDLPSAWAESQIPGPTNFEGSPIMEDDIYVFRTSQGRIAKLEITRQNAWGFDDCWWTFGADIGRECRFSFRWVVFDAAVAKIYADTSVLYDANASPIRLDGSGSKGRFWTWTLKKGPAGSSNALKDVKERIAFLEPVDPDVGGYEQQYEIELVIDSGQDPNERDTITIDVYFPMAKIDPTPDPIVFEPTDVRRVQLKGGQSVGARTYSWAIVKAPALNGNEKLENPNTANPVFIPDGEGQYQIELTINKGDDDEHTMPVTVNVKYN
jgi:hypothetical protein